MIKHYLEGHAVSYRTQMPGRTGGRGGGRGGGRRRGRGGSAGARSGRDCRTGGRRWRPPVAPAAIINNIFLLNIIIISNVFLLYIIIIVLQANQILKKKVEIARLDFTSITRYVDNTIQLYRDIK